jgi:hypothetical protein
MQLMMVMFCTAAGFLNFAYAFHFPLIVGVSLALVNSERFEKQRQNSIKTSISGEALLSYV